MRPLREKLKGIISKFPEVELAYLFGSYACNTHMPASDVDIAILVSDRKIVPHLMAEIAKEMRIAEEKVSILDLGLADEALKIKVLSKGVELVNRGIDLKKLVTYSSEVSEVLELEEYSSSKSWLRGDPIDITTLRDIASRLFEDVKDLEELRNIGYERMVSDKHLRKSLERTLQTSIEAMVDMLRHVVAGLNLGVAEYYKDYIEICRKNVIISSELADKILTLIPIRHTLVHKYHGLDYKKLWELSSLALEAARKELEELRAYLRTKLSINL